MGDFNDIIAFRHLTEELLDEEIEDLRRGWMSVFAPSTLEYDVKTWLENFMLALFMQEQEYFLPGLDEQLVLNMVGEVVPTVHFRQQIEAVWELMPATKQFLVEPITVQVNKEQGTVASVISWRNGHEEAVGQVESCFRLQPSSYTGWDVVQTSLLDDLQQTLKV